MENKKCGTCKKKAILDLKLTKKINCIHCGHLKYDINYPLIICDFKCSGLYWWKTDHEYDKNTNIVKADFVIEKDECNKCGQSDFHDALFTGPLISNPKTCDYCNNNARYDLKLTNDIHCSNCDEIMYSKKSTELVICSSQCKKSIWKPIEYLSKKKDDIVKILFQNNKNKCEKCGVINDSNGKFFGTKLDQI
jgi:hypothetical protein